jgi:hypothetical protein
VTHSETSVLSSRLHRLADDMAAPVDVVGQVRAARARHQKQRRGRIAILAVATATAAVVVGSAAAADLLTATPSRGEVAVPSRTAPATTEPAPPATPEVTSPSPSPSPSPSSEASGLPAGWESRSFQGVTFAVPPGARAEDTVDPRPVNSFMEGPSLTWNGPALGGGEFSHAKVMIVETFEGGMTPADGGEWFTVPGADSAYGGIEHWTGTEESGPAVESWTFWLQVLAGDRQILVSGTFPGGDAGEQMARDLFASIVVD